MLACYNCLFPLLKTFNLSLIFYASFSLSLSFPTSPVFLFHSYSSSIPSPPSPFLPIFFSLSFLPLLSLLLQVPPRPAGTIAVRYRVNYRSDGDRFTRVRFLFPRFAQRNASTLNTTLSFLRRNTNYTIQVRMEVRYSACFSYLPGNYSEPIIASTNATSEEAYM